MKNFQKSEIEKAIKKSAGIMSKIAFNLKCDWHTANKYIKLHKLEHLVATERELMLDIAESKLMDNIVDGDNTAIIFYLKTQGKKRGYSQDKTVIEIPAGEDGEAALRPQINFVKGDETGTVKGDG